MFIKRQLAIVVMISMGFLALAGQFINSESLREFTDKDAPQWYMIIAGFTAFLGCLNLLQLHTTNVIRKQKNWQYSIFTLLGFLLMIFFGFIYNGSPVDLGPHLKNEYSAFYWMYNYVYLPLSSTMFALLAFFVASASYRAFRIRNFEATLLLISGVLLMLGRVPIGALVPWWIVVFIYTSIFFSIIAHMIQDKKIFFISYLGSNILILFILYFIDRLFLSLLNLNTNILSFLENSFLSIPLIQEWIMAVPATAGSRTIMIGIALGVVAQSFRIITGRERSILGD